MVSRENRLLVIVVIVSTGALLLLARFRFPGENRPVNPAPMPLERLAAQATFDDLASIVANLQTRVGQALLVLRVVGRPTPPAPSIAKLLTPVIDDTPARPRLALAVRVRPGVAIAQLAPGDRVEGIVGAGAVPRTIAVDPIRLVGLIDVPSVSDRAEWIWRPSSAPVSPRYVAVAEATQGGPALRPLFLGRTDPFSDPRWGRPLLALGGAGVTQPGSLIFSLDGTLEGLTVLEENLPVIAPTQALLTAVDDLEQGRVTGGGDLGIQVGDLTPPLAAATGTERGAIVTYVRAGGPSNGQLRVGDVIDAINDEPIFSADLLVLRVARVSPGTTLRLHIVRQRIPSECSVVAAAPASATTEIAGASELGLVLRNAPHAGSEVLRVSSDSAARLAGIVAGDLITDLDGTPDPSPNGIERTFREADSGGFLLLAISRKGEHLMVAVRKR